MSIRLRLPHLVCYDISEPRRLRKIHRYLKKAGIPLQYSVFLLHVDTLERDRVVAAIRRIMHPREDDVRIYPLPRSPAWQLWGRPPWSQGLQLVGLPLPLSNVAGDLDQRVG